jgi:16S rRNA processing protein RimM
VAGQDASAKTGSEGGKKISAAGANKTETGSKEEANGGPAAGTSTALPAGRVGRAHGLDGSFYVTVPRPRLLTVGTSVVVAGLSAEIVRRAGTDRRPIVRLDGIEDRERADALRGMTLSVETSSAPALAEGEWWAHELEGCTVFDGERLIGTVQRMIELPSCEALEVRRETIGSQPTGSHPPAPLVVPMVKDAIRRMTVAERRIEIDMGFLGEHAPGPEPEPEPEPGTDGGR